MTPEPLRLDVDPPAAPDPLDQATDAARTALRASGAPFWGLTVPGEAAPGGSKRAFASPGSKALPGGMPLLGLSPGCYVVTKRRSAHRGLVKVMDANKNLKPWQDVVQAAAEPCAPRELLAGSLAVIVTFSKVRPKSHYRTGAATSHLLRKGAPARPTMAPDVTKLWRGTEDALTGIVYVDDALIAWQLPRKVYGPRDEVVIEVWEVGPA